MNIQVSHEARDKILEIMRDSEFKKPALRIVFAGAG